MIKLDKKDLEYMMEPIVQDCLEKHTGGENYFTELDGMIKNNEVLMVLFLLYAVQDSGINDVILSGEIGIRYLKMYTEHKIPDYINLYIVNGGLRKGNEVIGGITNNLDVIPNNLECKPFIFLDDSYYSGKTMNKVNEFLCHRNAVILKTYVFYDGSKDSDYNVKSLYRYYD